MLTDKARKEKLKETDEALRSLYDAYGRLCPHARCIAHRRHKSKDPDAKLVCEKHAVSRSLCPTHFAMYLRIREIQAQRRVLSLTNTSYKPTEIFPIGRFCTITYEEREEANAQNEAYKKGQWR